MIDVPLPGSTELAALRFPPEQLDWVPLNGWLPANSCPISWATWPTAKALAPTSSPITCRLRVSAEPPQVEAWEAVKQAEPPHGPFAPVIWAAVFKLRA